VVIGGIILEVYKRGSMGRIIFQCINYTVLTLCMVIALYPVFHVLAASVSSFEYLAKGKVGIIPKGFNIQAYKRVLGYPMIGRAYANTVFYTVFGTFISLLLSVFGAYTLSRRSFPGKNFFTKVVVVAMLFSAGMIPTFLVVKGAGLYNTVWAILLPTALSSFNLVILKTFFEQIPYELEESASLDGCNHLQILFKIMLPLAIPGIVTIGLFYAVYQWNSYFPAMLYLIDRKLVPIQIVLRDIVIQNQTNELSIELAKGADQISESVKYATIMVATIPIMLVYPFVQKYFIKGVMIGSIKG